MSLIYLASPYSHANPKVRQERYEQAVMTAALITERGLYVYSPIVHGHPITEFLLSSEIPDRYLFKYNKKLCTKMIQKCDEFWILAIEGWKSSVGVSKERMVAEMLNLPVIHVDIYGRKL